MTQPITASELAQLLDLHANPLRLFAAQWSNSPDDCVQEAFVQLAAQTFKPEQPLSWLYQVVRRRALNDLRGSKRRTDRERQIARPDLVTSNPADQLMVHEEHQRIQKSLDSLPAESRELIVLRIWSGLKWSEIGELTGCSSSAAQRRFVLALSMMKESLESKCLTKRK
ncbi:RNA polymerase sigma factor [Mariniblastus fucicola]|uniref:RNA polymerase sigma factor SigV n=1 Tax=Mariniblastus fucicola TaxID=980251 RepID=A0A5B9PEM7_9BACT|nr:sigma-70 family RNA polymerase sigma factor [Mariniblastus fucicola]QEG23046.1 RNA polymerase sigma factor SigV [Mariniblastus fucicola]